MSNCFEKKFNTHIFADLADIARLEISIASGRSKLGRTLAKILVLLEEALQARHDKLHRLLRKRLARTHIIRQHARRPMPFTKVIQQLIKPRQLLLHCALPARPALAWAVSECLQHRREVRLEVRGLGCAEPALEGVPRGRGEEGFDCWGRCGREDRGDEVGDVVDLEDRPVGGSSC